MKLHGFLKVSLQHGINLSLLLSVLSGLLVQFMICSEFTSSIHIVFLHTLISALRMTTSNLRLSKKLSISRSIDFISCQSVGSFPICTQSHFIFEHNKQSKRQAAARKVSAAGIGDSTCTLTYDTGTSQTSVGVESDFIILIANSVRGEVVKGIASGLDIKGDGTVTYLVDRYDGTKVTLTMKAMFVPELEIAVSSVLRVSEQQMIVLVFSL
jgi:hypothetical protein